MYSGSEKKRNTSIYFDTNYRTETKLVPIIMDYDLLQFDALKFVLGLRPHGKSLFIFNFFNENSQIFKRNRKEKTKYPYFFYTNYRAEIKLVPIIMDYYLLQFDALKFFLGLRLHVGSLFIFNFFQCKFPNF